MKKGFTTFCLISTSLISTAFAGSDTISCETVSKNISFSVGNGDHKINIKMKDNKSGQISIAALPVGDLKMLKSNNNVQVVYDKDGTLKCSGREFTDETYKQTMLLTQRHFDDENQSLDYQIREGKTIEGLSSSGYITAEFICKHEQATSSGGCYIDEGDIVKIEKTK